MIKKITLNVKQALMCILFAMCSTLMFAQNRTCGMVEYMQEQMKNPEFKAEYDRNQALFKARLNEMLANEDFSQRGSTIVIPVAVHFPTGNESDRACLEALAQNQIDILNEDYSGTNADIANWPAASVFYPGTNTGVANISFCIAISNHPTGLDPELLEGNPCVTIGYNFGGGNNQDANWAGYMNFVVRDIGGGLLGFSPFPGSIASGQAVTMNTFAFGSGPGCPGSGIVPDTTFGLGRTVTHELGHFYNLDHTFTGSCGTDDGIADTPNIADENYGCPPNGSVNACVSGQKALTMNYMDYVDDACMFMFSAGQTTVVDAYVSGVLQAQLKPGVCDPPTAGFNLIANNSPILSCPTNDTQVVFNLSYTAIAGFNETTTFSATGAPAGATVTFSPTTRTTSGDFTMTISNLGATAQGEYTIAVTGTSSSVTKNVNVLLKNTCTSVQCNTIASAQNLNIPIIDGSGGNPGTPIAQHTINIPGSQVIQSVTVHVNLTHTFISDLIIRIIHPNGTTFVDVWETDCFGEINLNVTFDDTASTIVCDSPTVGTYQPTNPLSAFNGLNAQGDWTILVADFFSGDTGLIKDWSITVCSEQPLAVNEFDIEGFKIFPNPNNGEFTVQLNSNSGNKINIDVFDIRGRKIFNNILENGSNLNETIKLNNVQSGMYLVKVSDGDKQVIKKIVVE